MNRLFANHSRGPWLSEWFSLFVAIAVGFAWLAIDSFLLHIDKGATAKLISAFLSALVAGIIALLLQLYGRLDRSLEMFQKLERSVSEISSIETRLFPSLYVSSGMKAFHAGLLEWHSHINSPNGSQASPIENSAWLSLADAYFRGERERIRNKTLGTTSNQYTSLINDISQKIIDSLIPQHRPRGDAPLLRLQITGMLPEEFYNAPQIEYTRTDSQPIFFCHRWEDYSALYGQEYRHDPQTQIRRYIVARDPQFQRSRLSALPTFNDLLEQISLVVCSTHARSLVNDIDSERREVLERLLRKTSIHSSSDGSVSKKRLMEQIRSIHDYDHYGYWPIAKVSEANHLEERSLLEFFISDYHGSSRDDARYCVIDEDAWAICEKNDQLKMCFEPGWVPEIALFGTQSQESTDNPLWHVGILGIWRPFTRDMRLRFLTATETKRLYDAFNRTYNRCQRKGSLLSFSEHRNMPI